MEKQLFVPYYRVSTEKQGQSGLGIEAQKSYVREYCLNNGTILEEFTDVFSGGSDEREGLLNAIELCKTSGAVLVAYDITRISRGGLNVRYILEKSQIKYIGALSPHDSSFSIGIKFEVAKEEKERISRNTTKALKEINKKIEKQGFYVTRAGKRITSLGGNGIISEKALQRAAEVKRDAAKKNPNNKQAYTLIKILREENGKSLRAIAGILNEHGYTTSQGSSFSATQVSRVYNLYQ